MPPEGFTAVTVPELPIQILEAWRLDQVEKGNKVYTSKSDIVTRLVIQFLVEVQCTDPRMRELGAISEAAKPSKLRAPRD